MFVLLLIAVVLFQFMDDVENDDDDEYEDISDGKLINLYDFVLKFNHR